MKSLRNTFNALWIVIATTVLLSAAAVAHDLDISGEWDMTVETSAGTGNPHFSLKQEGEKVTGTYRGMLGEVPVTGTVKGHDVTLTFKANAQGADVTVTYSGTVEDDTMKGKVALGDFGEGTFSGKKSK